MCACGFCGGLCLLIIPLAYLGVPWAKAWLDKHRGGDPNDNTKVKMQKL